MDTAFEVIQYICLAFETVALIAFSAFSYLYYQKKVQFNPYTYLCYIRSYVHIGSAIQGIIIVALDRTAVSSKALEDLFFTGLNITAGYFLYTEVIVTFNRFIAIAYWKYYDRIFTHFNCKIFYTIPLVFQTIFSFWIYYVDDTDQALELTFLITEILTLIAIIFNIITFVLIMRFKLKMNSRITHRCEETRVRDSIRPYVFSTFQLFISACLFMQLVLPVAKDDAFYYLLYYLLGNALKDFCEGLATILFFHKMFFGKRESNGTTNILKN